MICKEMCFLSPEAVEALKSIRAAGIKDDDLALKLLEAVWPDEAIYELPISENTG